MVVSSIAARYSRAFFELAVERNELEQVLRDMALISGLSKVNKDFRRMLKSPVISTHKKQVILRDIFKGHVAEMTSVYLSVITRKKREAYIDEIATEFVELYKDYKGILTTRLKSAAPVSDELRKEVVGLMNKKTGKEIDLVESVNEELIGGFILQWKDIQYDASILNQINKMKRELTRVNLYVKGF